MDNWFRIRKFLLECEGLLNGDGTESDNLHKSNAYEAFYLIFPSLTVISQKSHFIKRKIVHRFYIFKSY